MSSHFPERSSTPESTQHILLPKSAHYHLRSLVAAGSRRRRRRQRVVSRGRPCVPVVSEPQSVLVFENHRYFAAPVPRNYGHFPASVFRKLHYSHTSPSADEYNFSTAILWEGFFPPINNLSFFSLSVASEGLLFSKSVAPKSDVIFSVRTHEYFRNFVILLTTPVEWRNFRHWPMGYRSICLFV